MPVVSAKRTLVKSPPELWAEVSDPAALARHLEDFGDIRITRVEPESVVEWQGKLASGRVELDASGWGTKVRLTAQTPDPEPVAAEPEVKPEPEPLASAPEPEPEPIAVEPEPLVEPEPERRGFWARLFGRRKPAASVAVEPEPPAPEPEPEPEQVAPPPAPAPEPEPEPLAPPPAPELDAEAVLVDVLEALGSAHHRPFSRA